ncbi:MAG: hypothetical protein AAFP04_02155 [Myxococcota bacterium]
MAEETNYASILRSVPASMFSDVLGASTRKSRETYFARHGIKAPKGPGFIKPGAKNAARAESLREVLLEQDDQELAEEILRAYLLNQRPMLAAALDYLEIEHVDGLTDSDEVERFQTLNGTELKALVAKLEPVASRDDIRLYLKYMGCDGGKVDAAA